METNNMAAMRKALYYAREVLALNGFVEPVIRCDAALATPARNCDIGNTGEQYKRFKKFCFDHMGDGMNEPRCSKCPLGRTKEASCHFDWAQMPYKEENEE